MHGYDLRKRMREDFGLLSSLSFGSLYPALARLEAAGAVHEVAPTPAPADAVHVQLCRLDRRGESGVQGAPCISARGGGPHRRRNVGRRVYEITARGDELFHHLLETEEPKSEGGRGFALRWAFAGYLSPEARICSAATPWPTAGDPGGIAPGSGVALASARPLPALPRRPRQGSDRTRPQVDRLPRSPPSRRRPRCLHLARTCQKAKPLTTRLPSRTCRRMHSRPALKRATTERSSS